MDSKDGGDVCHVKIGVYVLFEECIVAMSRVPAVGSR